MPSAQPEDNNTWTGRARVAGKLNESKGGFRTKTEAKDWARGREAAVRERHSPRGKGPTRSTLAESLAIDALKTLPFKKGAVAEANRINLYLRPAGRPTLKVVNRTMFPEATASDNWPCSRKPQVRSAIVLKFSNGAVFLGTSSSPRLRPPHRW